MLRCMSLLTYIRRWLWTAFSRAYGQKVIWAGLAAIAFGVVATTTGLRLAS